MVGRVVQVHPNSRSDSASSLPIVARWRSRPPGLPAVKRPMLGSLNGAASSDADVFGRTLPTRSARGRSLPWGDLEGAWSRGPLLSATQAG